jgi:DNA-binding transcriptional LysR family regulator
VPFSTASPSPEGASSGPSHAATTSDASSTPARAHPRCGAGLRFVVDVLMAGSSSVDALDVGPRYPGIRHSPAWSIVISIIHDVNLAAFDLNLLVALDALLAERNVTRAARRVGITQPAMSNALARLRTALGDPLLVRGTGAMVPTPVALEVGRAAAAALREVERAVEGRRTFDAATSRRVFTVAASDYVAFVLLAPLAQHIAAVAPGVSLKIVPLGQDPGALALESGALDLTIGFFRKVPPGLVRARLFTDRLVAVVRRRHPVLRTRRTLADLARIRYVRVAPHGERRGLLDKQLAARGLTRVTALVTPTFLSALAVAHTDLCAVLPERVAKALGRLAPVSTFEVDAPLPAIAIDAFWHQRVQHDVAHVWLRRVLVEVAARGPRHGVPSR